MKNNLSIALLFATLVLCASCKKDFNISATTDDFFHVNHDGYLMPVQVRGNTASGKILLFVQGGPALNALDFARIDYPGWKNTLEKDYAVAYYEPRGMGNRQGTFDVDGISVDKYLDDVHAVAQVLKSQYGADVHLLGHSFGGYLTYRYMIKHGDAETVGKYIVANGPATTDYDTTLRWNFRHQFLTNEANEAIANGSDVSTWQGILTWLNDHPVLHTEEEFIQWNKYVEDNIYAHYEDKTPTIRDYAKVLFFSSYNFLTSNLNGSVAEDVEERLMESIRAFDLIDNLASVDEPILIITGRHDDVSPPEEVAYVMDHIASTDKTAVVIPDAGHESFYHQPELFRNAIKAFVEE